MTDFSKLTDKQINEAMQSFPNSMCLLDKKGNRKLIDYVENDAFCFRLIKDHGLSIQLHHFNGKNWEVTKYERHEDGGIKAHINIQAANLNRAVLETYLKIKSVKES